MFIRLRMELTSSVMLASPWMVCLMALLATAKLDHIHGLVVVQHGVDEAAGEGIAAAHAVEDINAGSAYAHYRFSLLCDTNVRQHFYLPITQPASIERCNGDGGEQFARTSVQLKQCFVLSAHLHCSLGLGICIAHWL